MAGTNALVEERRAMGDGGRPWKAGWLCAG